MIWTYVLLIVLDVLVRSNYFKRERWIGGEVRVTMQAKSQGMMMLVFAVLRHFSFLFFLFFQSFWVWAFQAILF